MTDLTLQNNYLTITQNHETPDGSVAPVLAFYPVTLTFISVQYELQSGGKGGQTWAPFSITLHNTALNATCIISNADILAGNVTRDSKLPFVSLLDLSEYLTSRTGSPVDDTTSTVDPVIVTPIKSLG